MPVSTRNQKLENLCPKLLFRGTPSCSMPSTGTPEPGGMLWYQVIDFLRTINQKTNVVGFDIVELCPNRHNKAPDFLAAKLLYQMLTYKFINHVE